MTLRNTIAKGLGITAFLVATATSGYFIDRHIEDGMSGKSHWYREPVRGWVDNYNDDKTSAQIVGCLGSICMGVLAGVAVYGLVSRNPETRYTKRPKKIIVRYPPLF